jgi:hypothetical protein
MGTWGTAIFSDDLAADVRNDWRDAIAGGHSPEEATEGLVAEYANSIGDFDEGPKFWFALAATQAATGRLQDAVRDRALALIDAGGDVALFAAEDPKLGARREAALRALAATLRGPQKAPTRITQPRPQLTPLAVGDVIRVRGDRGIHSVYFVVVAHAEGWPPGSTWPVLAGFLWQEAATPSNAALATLPFLREDPIQWRDRGSVVYLFTMAAPSRGARSWDKFATVVAHGIHRADAPDYEHASATGRGAQVGSLGWQLLAKMIDSEWLPRVVAITEAHLTRPRGGERSNPRWPWSRGPA